MKQTKRIMAFLMALLLTVTMLPVSVFAAENPTFTVSSASKKAGDEVTLSVDISNNPGFFAAQWTVSYDETRLEKVEYVMEEIDGVMLSNKNNNFLWENTVFEDIQYNGKVLDLKFKVKEDAPAGDAEVTITNLFAGKSNSAEVKFDVVAGKVTVAEKLETLIPFTKANHTDSGAPIHDKYSGIVGLKIEGIKVADWTEWQQGFNYQNQGITIYVDSASKDDTATLSLVLKEGQAGSGSIIDAPATVKLNNGEGSFTASYMKIGTGGLAPMLHIPITFKLACTEHDWADATCKAPKTCTICGATEGEALGHNWGATSYKWSEDGKACTATRVCKNDASHTETAEATVTSEVEKEPTCTESGITKYTAAFDVDWAETQTNSKADIEALGHSWVDADCDTPKTCSVCGATEGEALGHNMQETEAAVAPTCEEAGKTAVLTCANGCGKTEGGDEVPALGHDWADATYDWAEDGSACTATRVCKNDQNHTENATATEIKSEVAKPATCSAMGDTRYEAIFAEDWAHDYKAITDIPVDEDAHEWGEWVTTKEPTYSETGLKERECELCDEKEEQVIPKKNRPSSGNGSSNKPNPGVTEIVPGKGEEKNPNTGAPVFDLTAAGVVVLAATAAVLEIKRRK